MTSKKSKSLPFIEMSLVPGKVEEQQERETMMTQIKSEKIPIPDSTTPESQQLPVHLQPLHPQPTPLNCVLCGIQASTASSTPTCYSGTKTLITLMYRCTALTILSCITLLIVWFSVHHVIVGQEHQALNTTLKMLRTILPVAKSALFQTPLASTGSNSDVLGSDLQERPRTVSVE